MLSTEMSNPRTAHIDRMTTYEMLKAMNNENYRVAQAVEEALEQIAPLVDHVAAQMSEGGRLFYVGAGTSGRLGVLDAAECPPTFGVPPESVVALLAGGPQAMFRANAGCEDDADLGAADLNQYNVTPRDTVVGLSAAGGARYVLGAMRAAKKAGAATASICCNPNTPMAGQADFPICADTGPEVITGSTRLKAGSAQKMILNLLSTAVMVKQGKVYGNYMVSFALSNEKLRRRAAVILQEVAGCGEEEAKAALEQYGEVRAAAEALRAKQEEGKP